MLFIKQQTSELISKVDWDRTRFAWIILG